MSTPSPDSQPVSPHPPVELTDVLRVPILQETASITREVVETGRVRLTKSVTEHTETLPLELRHDQVHVTHVPVNSLLPPDAPVPETRYEGQTLIIPVLREVMVKHLLVVEELHVTRQQIVTDAPQTVTLRQEQVQVERLPPRSDPAVS